jgi:hypothetical protein
VVFYLSAIEVALQASEVEIEAQKYNEVAENHDHSSHKHHLIILHGDQGRIEVLVRVFADQKKYQEGKRDRPHSVIKIELVDQLFEILVHNY